MKYAGTIALLILSMVASGQQVELVVPRFHIGIITGVDLSKDGKYLLSASSDSTIILNDALNGKYLKSFKDGGRISKIEFLGDGLGFVTLHNAGLSVWTIEKSGVVQKLNGSFKDIAASPISREFVVRTSDKQLALFRESGGAFKQSTVITSLSSEKVSFKYSNDGQKLIFVDRQVKVFDINSGKVSSPSFKGVPPHAIRSAALSPDQSFFALGMNNGSIIFYNIKGKKIVDSLVNYPTFWSGTLDRGITRDSSKVDYPVTGLEFTGSGYLASWQIADTQEIRRAAGITIWDYSHHSIKSSEFELIEGQWTFPTAILNESIAFSWRILNFVNNQSILTYGDNSTVDLAQYFPDGKRLFLNANNQSWIWDLESGSGSVIPFEIAYKGGMHQNQVGVESDYYNGKLWLFDANELKVGKELQVDVMEGVTLNRVKPQVALGHSGNAKVPTLRVLDFKTNKLLFNDARDERYNSTAFSSDGELFFVRKGYEKPQRIYGTDRFTLVDSLPAGAVETMCAFNNIVYFGIKSADASYKIVARNIVSRRNVDSMRVNQFYSCLQLSRDGKWLAVGSFNGSLMLMNREGFSGTRTIQAHGWAVKSIDFSPDGRFMVTTGSDGAVKFWDMKTLGLVAKILFFGKDWVAVNDDGQFDGSAGGLEKLFFINGLQTIELNQLKDRYYEPGLLSKALGLSKEPLRKSQGLNTIKPYPKIQIEAPSGNDKGLYTIRLTNQGGGIGKVRITINGKEAVEDARGAADVDANEIVVPFKVAGHPYLKPNAINQIEIRAYNKEGYLLSPAKKINYISEGEEKSKIHLYAVVIGTSDYNGTALDLRFAAKDAEQIGQALQQAGTKLFGKDGVTLHMLTTERKDNWPTKENIKNALAKVASVAQANDIVLVYLAGHGTNFGSEESDFYYLTADAQNGNLVDPVVRNQVAISSGEFTELIKKIPALKQVMILDACHSGKFAEDLLAKRDVMSSGEVKALERMKDRTGMYILMGSAADAVSYEATSYGQGLLTYSLLFGIKGAALREKQFVDVMSLFQYSVDEVPRLASNIGGIQKPELRVPFGGESFDIGEMDADINAHILLPVPRPIFLRSVFQDEDTFADPLGLSDYLDEQFKNGTGEKIPGKVIFIDAMKFPDGFSLRGRYKKVNNIYKVNLKLFRGDSLIKDISVTGTAVQDVAGKILDSVMKSLP